MAQSEIAHLMHQIDVEYEAAQLGLQGLAITATHASIMARMTNLSGLREQLVGTLGESEGNRVFCERYFSVQMACEISATNAENSSTIEKSEGECPQ